jgi:2-polyprenyl-3-methyl-5-hydroxy-6-metoxy-1,4-benzoquinol methylase
MKEMPTLAQLDECYKNYSYDKAVFVSPITIKRYNEILDVFEKYRSTGRLLDVGCGVGLFLEVAITRGWEVYGTEYSERAVEICQSKGINMKRGALAAKDFGGLEFDVVTSFEVIEHISNPQEDMREVIALMRKGGLFYCTTPNFNALMRYYLKSDYDIIGFPEHLSYYTPSTLSFLCERMGLTTLKVKADGISLSRITRSISKDRKLAIVGKDSQDEKLRESMENNILLQGVKSLANAFFNTTGLGYALKGYFVKK